MRNNWPDDFEIPVDVVAKLGQLPPEAKISELTRSIKEMLELGVNVKIDDFTLGLLRSDLNKIN